MSHDSPYQLVRLEFKLAQLTREHSLMEQALRNIANTEHAGNDTFICDLDCIKATAQVALNQLVPIP